MPYNFTFQEDDTARFSCPLVKGRCSFVNPRTEKRCERTQYLGFDVCWQHLRIKYKIRIAQTTLKGVSGRGLFAFNNTNNKDIVFKSNDNIITYRGQPVSADDLEQRYGDKTAPYAVVINKTSFIDAGCERGVGSFANHKPRSRANAKLSFYKGVITLKATKNIRNGDEIFVSYGDVYRLNEEGVSHQTKYVRR